MAKKDKKNLTAEGDEPEKQDGAEEGQEGTPQQGFVKKLLGNKKLLMIAGGGALALLLAIGAGLYFFVFSGTDDGAKTKIAAAQQTPIVPPQVAYYDVPDLIVNIQTPDGTPAYLKLSVALELNTADEKAGLQALMPRIVDQFQGYLRELRVDDLKGSAGIMRLKEELLRRINAAAAPYRVRDVLLKEMIVQ
ncbi:MAG: flagellar basal body-associated FliL family protein [Alphaproteobacteria bacterium]|nr:flagellar basal body-associated FliL family protein [Alphaproteobacteria bacterium]MDE2109812.1 flagellar basal body-associated FliL family protein [Alphaproteobacteria bacterium]MDE2495841.1 flagellar basal body-associated FliL family protein [Alphaproteobacteria bacterium]